MYVLSDMECLSEKNNLMFVEVEQIYFFVLYAMTVAGIVFFKYVKNTTKTYYLAFHVGSIIGVFLFESFVLAAAFAALLFLINHTFQLLKKKFTSRIAN